MQAFVPTYRSSIYFSYRHQLMDVYLLLTELVAGLRDQRLADGTTDSVGEVLINWVRVP